MIDDRYVLEAVIGRGGMADVHRATDRVLHRRVAVKVLREASVGTNRGRFIDEARTLASLNHPGLVTLLDAGIEGDRPYLVMEYAEGATLAEALHGGPLAPIEVARLGRVVAQALGFAHAAGIVHRDVKPSNVLFAGDGRVLLADFGIAKLIGAVDHHTRTGDAIGSPAYLAPEQVVGEPVSAAIDIYSLGLVLLEALTGERAYSGAPIEAAVARLSVAPALPESLPAPWCTLITAMTDRDPSARPGAEEVVRALTGLSVNAVAPAEETPSEETRVIDLGEEVAAGPALVGGADVRGPRRIALVVLVLLGILLAAALYLAHPQDAAPSRPGLPAGVPSGLQTPLQSLHDAIEEAP